MIDREKIIKGIQDGLDFFEDRVHGSRFEAWVQAQKDALALLKAQEPRVMTEQEMRDAEPGAVIYCEQRDEVRTYLTPMIKYDDGMFENRFLGAAPEATQLPNVRFWTSRPTDEQRERGPWDDAER